MSELRFDGRSVIVTGAGRGFGRCHAFLLASRGARVVVADYGVNLDGTGSSPEPAEDVAKEIAALGGEAVPCFASVADEAGAGAIVQTALDAFGGVDVLVNNAGVADPDWFEDTDMERFRRMNQFQYLGTAYMCKAAWPHLKAAEHGCIVNTASEAVTGFVPKCASYSGAKGGVYSLTRALALDGRRFGLRANAVSPRGNTRMSAPDVMSYFYDAPAESFQTPFMEQMRPEFVSPAVAYLAHDSCPLNGETLICGGLSVMRLAVIQTKGITTTDTITPEDIAGRIDAVMDPTGAMIRDLENPPH
jgi:NAD(P)-dependent dehydrogenase (short-subunit alcohol dehydrogenase family)